MADHRLYAALYDRMMARAESGGLGARRRRLLAEARGRVLEVGGGTGANLPHYRDVESVTVLEPDGAMRRRLYARLAATRVPTTVVEAGIDDAPFGDASFDTVVTTLVLCTIPDLDRGLRLMHRLLAPGGRLLFMEHVRSTGWRRRLQHAVTPAWTRVVPGCHLDRDITGAIRRAGFAITDCERFHLPGGGPLAGAAVQGVAIHARRPVLAGSPSPAGSGES